MVGTDWDLPLSTDRRRALWDNTRSEQRKQFIETDDDDLCTFFLPLLQDVVKGILDLHQSWRATLQQLDNITVSWLDDANDVRKKSAPSRQIRALMRRTEKADPYCARFDGFGTREATFSRYVQSPLRDQSAEAVNNENNSAIAL